jgi:Fe-S cluster assembly iron-binding protein IscA
MRLFKLLTVTERAKDKLMMTLLENTVDKEEGLRLKMKSPGQLGLVLDKESPDDNTIEHEGLKLLIVGHELGKLLQGVTLDVRDTPDGPRLTILKTQ